MKLPSLNLRLRHRFAAFGLVGGLILALPLVQVLRYQATALTDAAARENGLNPVGEAIVLQRGLLGHRDLAAEVLRGRAEREAQRTQAQREVDEQATRLNTTLDRHGNLDAREEALALHGDWIALANRIQQRSVAAEDSDAAHRLLVEQVVQVLDLLSLHSGLAAPQPGGAQALAPAVTRALPRLLADIARLAPAGGAPAHPREFVAVERRLAALHRRLASASASAAALAPGLAPALAMAQAEAARFFELQRQSSEAQALHGAAARLLQAQHQLADQAQASLRGALAAQRQAAQWQLGGWALAAAALLGLLAWLASQAFERRPPPRPRRIGEASDESVPPTEPFVNSRHGHSRPQELEAGRLLARMRQPARGQPAAPQDASPTLPPRG